MPAKTAPLTDRQRDYQEFSLKVEQLGRLMEGVDLLHQPDIQQALITFMRDDDAYVKVVAFSQFRSPILWQQYGVEPIRLVGSNTRYAIDEELLDKVEPVITELVRQTQPDQPDYSRGWAVITLGELGPGRDDVARALLQAAVQHRNSYGAIGLSYLPRVPDDVLQQLRDIITDSEIKDSVAQALGAQLSHRQEWRELVNLMHHAEFYIQVGALKGVTKDAARYSLIRYHLLALMGDSHDRIKTMAIEALEGAQENGETFQAGLRWLARSVPGRSSYLQRYAKDILATLEANPDSPS